MSPFYLTNLLEYYSGVFIYSVGVIDATTGQSLAIIFGLIPFFFGADVYLTKISDILPFLPSVLSEGYILRDLMMVIIAYIGVLYPLILVVKTFMAAPGVTKKALVTIQVAQHIFVYVLMYLFNNEIPFIRDNAGLCYLSVIFGFVLVSWKLIICHMAYMEYNIIHFELFLYLPFFYVQSKYDGTEQSETNIKIAFYITFAVISLLTARFVQTSIEQLARYLNIYCLRLGQREEERKSK